MRFYPNADIKNYWEIPACWSLCCNKPNKSWKRKPLQAKHTMTYWRDLEGDQKAHILKKDLYLKDWPCNRIRPEACLPWYYCVGNRFIKLEKAFPAGFKCAPLPINLKEVLLLKEYTKQLAKMKRAEAKEAKKFAKET